MNANYNVNIGAIMTMTDRSYHKVRKELPGAGIAGDSFVSSNFVGIPYMS